MSRLNRLVSAAAPPADSPRAIPHSAELDVSAPADGVAVPQERGPQPVRAFSDVLHGPLRAGPVAACRRNQHDRDEISRRILDPVFAILEAAGFEVVLVNARRLY